MAFVLLVAGACSSDGSSADEPGEGGDAGGEETGALDPRCPSQPWLTPPPEEDLVCRYEGACVIELEAGVGCSGCALSWALTAETTCSLCVGASDGDLCWEAGETCELDGCYVQHKECGADHRWVVTIQGDPTCV